MRRARNGALAVSLSFALLGAGTALATPAPGTEGGDRLQLETHWGELASLWVEPGLGEDGDQAAPVAGDTDLEVPRPSVRSLDVTRVIGYQPRIKERPPYEPGVRMNDHVATAIIAAGGAALITSVIIEMLR
jgi:hypothetical protein